MKKIILTVLTVFTFVICNAQVKTKANHNTVRSNQHQGIMVKGDIKGKFDASKIRRLKIGEIIVKDYVLIDENNHYYTYDGAKNIVQAHLKKTSQQKNNCPCFIFKKLESTPAPPMMLEEEGDCCDLLCPVHEVTNNTNSNGQIVIQNKGKTYYLEATKENIKNIRNSISKNNQQKSGQQLNNNNCPDGCSCLNGTTICIDAKDNLPSAKKRNKNFNRKGVRVKRTKF